MTLGTCLSIVLAAFGGSILGGLVMEWLRTIILMRRSRQVKEYIEDLETCDKMLQDMESSISAINKQGGAR